MTDREKAVMTERDKTCEDIEKDFSYFCDLKIKGIVVSNEDSILN